MHWYENVLRIILYQMLHADQGYCLSAGEH